MNAETLYVLGIMAICWLMLIGASAFLPYYTRKSIAFGIAVPKEEFQSEYLSTVRSQYIWGNLVFGVLFMAISLWAILRLPENTSALISVGLLLGYLIPSFILYARAYLQVRDFKRESEWTISTVSSAVVSTSADTRTLFSPWWYLTFLIPIGAVSAYSLARYDELPEMIPQQVEFSGEVITYAEKTLWIVLSMPLMMLAMAVLFAFLGWMINRVKRQTDDRDIARGLRHNRTFQIVMGQAMFWLGLALIGILAGTQLSILGLLTPQFILWATFAFLALIIGGMGYVFYAIGQGGYRLTERERTDEERARASEVAEDDSNWILFGTLYNNREDPSLFVEKRVGMGWTTNVGHPVGRWLMIITAILLVALIVALPFLMMLDMR